MRNAKAKEIKINSKEAVPKLHSYVTQLINSYIELCFLRLIITPKEQKNFHTRQYTREH